MHFQAIKQVKLLDHFKLHLGSSLLTKYLEKAILECHAVLNGEFYMTEALL